MGAYSEVRDVATAPHRLLFLDRLPYRGMKAGGDAPSGRELAGLGIFLAASVVIPLIAGLFIDRALHTSPAFVAAGLLAGIVLAVVGLYSRLRRYL